jgi:hypothetical protein
MGQASSKFKNASPKTNTPSKPDSNLGYWTDEERWEAEEKAIVITDLSEEGLPVHPELLENATGLTLQRDVFRKLCGFLSVNDLFALRLVSKHSLSMCNDELVARGKLTTFVVSDAERKRPKSILGSLPSVAAHCRTLRINIRTNEGYSGGVACLSTADIIAWLKLFDEPGVELSGVALFAPMYVYRGVMNNAIVKALSVSTFAANLTLLHLESLDDDTMKQLALDSFPKLTSLTLMRTMTSQLEDVDFNALAKVCSNLNDLHLSRLRFSDSVERAQFVRSKFSKVCKLQLMEIGRDATMLSLDGLLELFFGVCDGLTHLKWKYYVEITPKCLKSDSLIELNGYGTRECLMVCVENARGLKSLQWNARTGMFDEKTIVHVASCCPNLETMRVEVFNIVFPDHTGTISANDFDFSPIENLSRLHTLHLPMIILSGSFYSALCAAQPPLKCLNVFTQAAHLDNFHDLLRTCRGLVNVDLAYATGETLVVLSGLPLLQSLSVRFPAKVEDYHLETLARGCSKMEFLTLNQLEEGVCVCVCVCVCLLLL